MEPLTFREAEIYHPGDAWPGFGVLDASPLPVAGELVLLGGALLQVLQGIRDPDVTHAGLPGELYRNPLRRHRKTAKARSELAIGDLLDQLRKCLYDLVLGVKNIPQRVQEKVVHGFNVFAEEAHFVSPIANPHDQ